MRFPVGSWVRVKGSLRKAKVIGILNIRGGRRLNAPLQGFKYWNIDSLVRVGRKRC